MRCLFFLLVLAVAGIAAEPALPAESPAAPTKSAADAALATLEARRPTKESGTEVYLEQMGATAKLVETNVLKTGDDFFRAYRLIGIMPAYEYRTERIRYELLLASAAENDARAPDEIPRTWNGLMSTLGRGQRMTFIDAGRRSSADIPPAPAPACIQAVLKDVGTASSSAATATDNPEVKTLVDADQDARKQDWSRLDSAAIAAIHEADEKRNSRLREIIAAGDLKTANDFSRASLVMQHSDVFPDYQLAHELAVCSLLLGDRQTGRWLVTATYDRMLHSVGHDQRFGTQSGMIGSMPIDEAGTCDNVRTALGSRPLWESKANSHLNRPKTERPKEICRSRNARTRRTGVARAGLSSWELADLRGALDLGKQSARAKEI